MLNFASYWTRVLNGNLQAYISGPQRINFVRKYIEIKFIHFSFKVARFYY